MTTTVTPPKPDGSSRRIGHRRGETVPVLLRPFVYFVAKIQARLETKLLAGFLGISVLMLALGVVGLLAVNRMHDQVREVAALHEQSNNANKMLYSITSQSHFRTMALLTGDPVWTEKIATAKTNFQTLLDETETHAIGDHQTLFDNLRVINVRYTAAGDRVEAIQVQDPDQATLAHIQSEHEISHELEDQLNAFIRDTDKLVDGVLFDFSGDTRFLTVALGAFSAMSLLGALAVGAIISWTVIGPVRKIDEALDTIASGDFTARIEVPNRDEFGKLSENVNRASEQLETLYGRLETVNRDLQTTVDEQVALLEHTSVLRRYLSPQVAEAIVAGRSGIGESRRQELTIVFADVRGFTALSEQSEPEEMIGSLNRFLAAMTEVVFRYEGTLDKYIGDALMIFFNDPLPQEDHAERAVRMALDMQKELIELRAQMADAALMKITAGIGISTGFVTVGNIGSPTRMDYTVMGNYVNLASRLADDAGPGEILISERTLALLPSGLVTAESAGERNLKGVQRPIALFRVTDASQQVEG